MEFKTGVSLKGIQSVTLLAMILCEDVYKKRMLPMTVTSVSDGKHKDGSLHYRGLAFDLRTKGTGSATSLYNDIKQKLHPLGYDVLLEYLGGDNEHLHIEAEFER